MAEMMSLTDLLDLVLEPDHLVRCRSDPQYGALRDSLLKDGQTCPVYVLAHPERDDLIICDGLHRLSVMEAEGWTAPVEVVICTTVPRDLPVWEAA